MEPDLKQWSKPLTAFAGWLEAQDMSALKQWARKLRSARSEEIESAVAEAVTWDYIACRCDTARLAEIPGVGGVDFEFEAGSKRFRVEVTNISVEAATTGTGMPASDLYSGCYGLLTSRIRDKVQRKFKQAASNTDAPLLVAVTTLHWNASCSCFDRKAVEFALGSPPRITSKWNPQTGESEGDIYESVDLKESVFLTPNAILDADGRPIVVAKYEPISGFLLGGFGLSPRDVRLYGGLNPAASALFDPALLPDVPFCALREWPVSESLGFSWTITEEDERSAASQAAETRLRAAGLGHLVDEIRSESQSRRSSGD